MQSLVPQSLAKLVGIEGEIAVFKIPDDGLREVHRNAPTAGELGWQPVTGFADAYPILLMNITSVRDLNQRIKNEIERLSVLRYRGNIVGRYPSPPETPYPPATTDSVSNSQRTTYVRRG